MQDPNFSIVEPEGLVPPHSETEITVQFTPDYTRDYEVVAFLEVKGHTERLPVVFKAKGLVRGGVPVCTCAHMHAYVRVP